MTAPGIRCSVCSVLLEELSAKTELLYSMESGICLEAILWDKEDGDPSNALVLKATQLREECSILREHIEQHQLRFHAGECCGPARFRPR